MGRFLSLPSCMLCPRVCVLQHRCVAAAPPLHRSHTSASASTCKAMPLRLDADTTFILFLTGFTVRRLCLKPALPSFFLCDSSHSQQPWASRLQQPLPQQPAPHHPPLAISDPYCSTDPETTACGRGAGVNRGWRVHVRGRVGLPTVWSARPAPEHRTSPAAELDSHTRNQASNNTLLAHTHV